MSYLIALCPTIDRTVAIRMNRVFSMILLVLTVLPMYGKGQNPISLQFDNAVMTEDFSDKDGMWPYLTTMENLYVPDKDEYYMNRRNKTTPYAIISSWNNNLSVFNIISTLKLGPSERKEQTIGIIFLVQTKSKGAVVFEFNKFKQYRIKRLEGAYYKFISGDAESEGWVKSSVLAGKNEYNKIDIRVDLPQVDIYANGKFLQSFDLMDYSAGSLGLLIGPDTKAKSDYFYVYTTADGLEKAKEDSVSSETGRSAVEQLSKLRYELEQLKRSLHECELERQTAVTRLEDKLAELTESNERLSGRNRQLQEFKNQVLVEVDEDVYLTLAKNLKEEILNNQKLESELQIYRDSLKITHSKYNRLKLVLLDKAIVKATKEKSVRDKKDVARTKAEIEKELKDRKMLAEQQKWETVQSDKSKTGHTEAADPAAEKAIETQVASQEDSAELEPATESRPLPVKVRKAHKRTD